MGKPMLWPAERVQQSESARLVTDSQIENWNNKLENIIVTDWNNAITSGFYSAVAGATNAPDTSVSLSGYVINSDNLIIQQLYPEDTSEELVYYIRKGFNNNGNITWSKWFITNLYMEVVEEPYNLTPILKGYDYNELSNGFCNLAPYTVTSIIFTDISMPSDATLIDVDEDGDGGVVAWLDTNDNTKMYVSTQHSGIKVEGNKNSYGMFRYKDNLAILDLSNFDTSNVSNIGQMFYRCTNLTALDVSGLDTSNVTKMDGMFQECTSLTALDVSNFNTDKVTDMGSMFNLCSNLTTLDLSNFNTNKVTKMDAMFSGCSKLTTLNISNFDTSKVTSMIMMFSGCSKLTTLNISNFDTSKVTKMDYMFDRCSNLTTIKVGDKFKWADTLSSLGLDGTWQDETGTQYTSSSTFPSNVAHTYTKVS